MFNAIVLNPKLVTHEITPIPTFQFPGNDSNLQSPAPKHHVVPCNEMKIYTISFGIYIVS